jgi:hypothetical protein
MTTQQVTSGDRARAYIDSVVAINRKYGMDGSLSDDDYNQAVADAEAVVVALRRTPASS